jgi:general secretion pathway protein H
MRGSTREGNARAAGFTLVEMLVCIAILVLLMAAFAPAFSGSRAKTRLATAAHALALSLRATRELALADGRPKSFALDLDRRTYRGGGGAQPLDPAVSVVIAAAGADARGGAILFFADGGSSGGVVHLSLEQKRLDVVVDWLTGRVSVTEPDG